MNEVVLEGRRLLVEAITRNNLGSVMLWHSLVSVQRLRQPSRVQTVDAGFVGSHLEETMLIQRD